MKDDSDGGKGGQSPDFVAFVNARRVGTGALPDVAIAVCKALQTDPAATILVFDRRTGQVLDLDLRGSEHEIIARTVAPRGANEAGPVRRGRPRLGVIAREVTLLPRHWDWLAQQQGGASVTIRRMVEAARKANDGVNEARLRNEATYRFMAAIAGDLAGFEEALRALFAGDRSRLEQRTLAWPADIHAEVLRFFDGPAAKEVL